MRGLAHVGVLAACHALGIRIGAIVGTSVGALVGAFYAGGMSIPRMRALAEGARKSDLFDVDYRGFLSRGTRVVALYRGEALRRFLVRHLPATRFDGLRLPLCLNAVSLTTGAHVVFGAPGWRHVPLVDAVCASAALPGFFPPVPIGDEVYVDGAVLDAAPIALARAVRGATTAPVILAHLEGATPLPRVPPPAGIFGVLERVNAIRARETFDQGLRAAHDLPLVVIAPDVVRKGELAARAALANHPLLRGARG
jgi:NTE family protein